MPICRSDSISSIFAKLVNPLLVFIIVSVRLWYAFDPHPFRSGVNPTASFLSGVVWVFGIVVSAASLYFLYWTYWLKRRRSRT